LKYWRGFLVALIFGLITWGLNAFAAGHTALVDMVYPYMTRMVVGSLADWSSGTAACLWQALLLVLIAGGIASIVLMIVLRWNPIQWLGWVLAAVFCVNMFSTLIFGLNSYAGPVSEDVRLTMTDYTVSELADATKYYRDKANELCTQVSRDSKGQVEAPSFEELAVMAENGFTNLTYRDAISLFSGSTAPVKKLGWSGLYGGQSGLTVALTGEACVNPNVPELFLPFAMCKEMCRRMTVVQEEDAKYAGYMAAAANDSVLFRYSAYCVAYYHCYNALAAIPTDTARQSAKQVHQGAEPYLAQDMALYEDFFGAYTDPDGDSLADMLTSWYIQEFITPLLVEVEDPFDPLDKNMVDLTYEKPDPTPLEEVTAKPTEPEDEDDEDALADEALSGDDLSGDDWNYDDEEDA